VRSWSFVAVVLTIALLFGGAAAVLAYDSSQSHTIADGIRVAGVDVGGLSVGRAEARVRAAYQARLRRPLVLRFGSQHFRLTPNATHVRVEVNSAVQQALLRTRSDDLFTRVVRSMTGGQIDSNIDPGLTISRPVVNRLISRVQHVIDRPAHDATISFSGDSIGRVASQNGREVDVGALRAGITSALSHGASTRPVRIPVTSTEPKLSTETLSERYPTIITVDRAAFRLRLWKHLKLAKQYTIAVGMAGLQTPAGLYHVQDKQVDPSWHVPNSAWAGSLAGQTIPPGPADPIKARWLGIYNGAGIHGTDELNSLGTAASHGCIRMAIPDVIALYDQTPLGTPVYIA
jgi:lipoprotein-anchoring transpeptidase ErfK/SrfK